MAKPVVHVESAHDKKVERQAAERSKRAAEKKRVQKVSTAVSSVQKSVFHRTSPIHVKAVKLTETPVVAVKVDVPTVSLGALVNLTSAPLQLKVDVAAADLVDVRADLPLLPVHSDVSLFPVHAAVSLTDPAVGDDVTGAGVRSNLPPTDAHPSRAPVSSLAVIGTSAVRSARPADLTNDPALIAHGPRPVAASPARGLPALPSAGTSGAADLGVAPAGSAGATGSGPVAFALTEGHGLLGLQAVHYRSPSDRSDRAWRLARQPGFAPD